nr:protein lunapark [Hymenolepis microstoma]
MNTETYNKAHQILKQFDPLGLIVRDSLMDQPVTKVETDTTARQRNVSDNKSAPCTPKPVPTAAQTPHRNPPTTTPTPLKGPITHRPILPRERSILDIVVDAIVGDGPDRRYALICQSCLGHNGMALAEEFEYLGKRLFVINLKAYGIPTFKLVVKCLIWFALGGEY